MDPTKPVEITDAEEQLIIMLRDFAPLFNRFGDDPVIETQVYFNRKEQRWEMKVGGFYKHGSVTIYFDPGQDVAIRGFTYHEYRVVGRYGDLDTIKNFDDLVGVNFVEWQSYRDRAPGWNKPDSAWIPHLEKSGRVKKRVETITHYEAAR
jgi:hypothetical protein